MEFSNPSFILTYSCTDETNPDKTTFSNTENAKRKKQETIFRVTRNANFNRESQIDAEYGFHTPNGAPKLSITKGRAGNFWKGGDFFSWFLSMVY